MLYLMIWSDQSLSENEDEESFISSVFELQKHSSVDRQLLFLCDDVKYQENFFPLKNEHRLRSHTKN